MRRRALVIRHLGIGALALLLSACAETQFVTHTAKKISKAQESPVAREIYKIGEPYEVDGIWYYPAEDYDYDETGIASWYGPQFHQRPTANGEIFDMNKVSAAHKTLPMPSFARVTNLENGRSLVIRINDRGPFVRGRIIDLSRRAAQLLGFEGQGTARARVEIMADESRAIAARLRGQTQLAAAERPIVVDSVRRPVVTAETLAPPPGTPIQRPGPRSQPRLVGGASPSERERPGAVLPEPPVGAVSQGSVRQTALFVQAGAFAFYDNADRVRTRLASLGGITVSPMARNGKDLYRVRLGPLTTVEDADKALDRVIAAGYPDARIVVD